MNSVERVTVEVGQARLSVLEAGEGPAVVLLHGIPTAAELWRGVLQRLAAAGCRAVAPDLPGYGHTRLPASADHSLAGAAELIARWLVDAAVAPAWVVGHDAGGAVAQLLAVNHPDLMSRLALTNSIVDGSWPAPRARLGTWGARAGLYRPMAALRLLPNPYMRREIRRGFADPARVADVDAEGVFWDGKFTDPGGRAAFERHLAALSPQDTAVVAPRLADLPMPCQLVWGMADQFQTWAVAGRRLEALLPSPQVVRLEGCGHFTPLECPDRLVAALLSHKGQA